MKVLLLAGGDSGERQVSLDSGAAVYDSLKRLGYTVYAIDPASGKSLLTSDGKFLTGHQQPELLPQPRFSGVLWLWPKLWLRRHLMISR